MFWQLVSSAYGGGINDHIFQQVVRQLHMATNQYTESEQAKKQTPTIGSDMHTATNAAHEAYPGHLRYFA